ncbi:bifunctional hydroxymethylpyrimidine kinase/phosphomethylpyrimidine kinase [Halorarius halobius]|uniref:bifunctional hydroxymethylpyrimidine kinase/phosphomethylpyrimidine kinase n=1 Tax=Halorarius halobius TaxID=2962671 RepID=UPI0020CBDDB0|nr:bifunctional hydroxymethylpyrimidine kinase/phosphomethylpyrimidine kinase [Halorarius halobius]
MRQPAPTDLPVVCTVAGSDSGGGAGVQADLKTFDAHGAFGTSVVTAVTAQNTTGVASTHVLPVEEIEAQLDAVLDDFDVRAVKTGMLATSEVVECVAERAPEFDCPLVVDPVMVAASGDRLLSEDAEAAYEDLIAEATLVTPNVDEAEVLTDVRPDDEAGQRLAGQRLLTMGADAALVKGGHAGGDEVRDTLVTPDAIETATHPRVDTDATHGSGCTLSSAVAARLARDEALPEAVGRSVEFMERAVRYAYDAGTGPGAVHHAVDARNDAARDATREAVEDVVAWFVDADVSAVVPEVGMQVVGATPYAESPADCAAIEGRITRIRDGIHPNRGVRFGVSSHVARFLVTAREFAPELRFAVNCRFDDGVADAIDALGWDWTAFDRSEEPDDVKHEEGSTQNWGARQAFADREEPPAAVADYGEVGKEPIVKVVGESHRAVAERVVALAEELA